ncbi:MAG: hypothetical protein UU65_C0002G0252 [candidate division CPR2 bacterium GW2011_GWC1_41_48]|uniref:Transcription regulator PadR N-terminal domain-containing protein n=1 Tax=candidate division CPR2 bacterium GW2011_GWC1_41_48 TaxID=1618344 RepID=A0A0G0W8Z4_UNCC2|nr:MAG: hypothetical protein UT47_C0002G0052 [candidate division CPR2 bacterium GW2011_GWC2_39_35]KKR28977.1 MAG: hypothetical protein UT60_C0008G0020 [candidate division CPR2 bacterium GW2011_GWD2_39_7]KKR29253.1 MAG: hypothetical protein UT59_C0010G0005 [candidate division CPR2 bacterium GW2011_GWD1_39_7]KKS09474.1 MAG: hypothetical protein UU65_C0002G0252 [candidate division CPR2 bacterium GW2011_GWC1_41_48]OGB62182.1 MAG: PadR family transcriptional regulator [candidate division CPR2 bacter
MELLSNSEFAILQLIAQSNGVSGYDINKTVDKRGYREWANIGTTSIYVGLEKLEKKKFVKSKLDSKKTGRGPLPKKFSLTPRGRETLKKEIIEGLSLSREKSPQFDLALASLPLVTKKEAVACLKKRKNFLSSEADRIQDKFEQQGGKNLPIFVSSLFSHPLAIIKAEIKFVEQLIEDLEKEKAWKK